MISNASAQEIGAEQPSSQAQQTAGQNDSSLDIMVQTPRGAEAGVVVTSVARQGAGELAGLAVGDVILSYNGQKVTSPRQLRELISAAGPDDQADLLIHRDGRQGTLTVDFGASGAPQQRERRAFRGETNEQREVESQAWLGVALNDELESDAQAGARVDRVFPSGPAARAGLIQGDVITGVNGRDVSTIEQLQQQIDALKPGDQADIAVDRDGAELTLAAVLVDRSVFIAPQTETPDDFPFEEEVSDIPEHAMMLEQHRHMAQQHERIEGVLRQLVEEIQALRQDLNRRNGANGYAAP